MINLLGTIKISDYILFIVFGIILVVIITLFFVVVPTKIWLKCKINGAKIGTIKLISLKQQKIDFSIIDSYIMACKSDIYIDIDELIAHKSAGGRIESVINGLIYAKSVNVGLSIDTAKAIDLSNRDVCEVVKSCVNSKSVLTNMISAITRDYIEVKVKAKVLLKPILTKIVGGIGEDTIISRIEESISSSISGFENYEQFSKNFDLISNIVLSKNLDKDTSYKICSVEIVSAEIGRDFGSQLRISRMEEEQKKLQMKMEETRFKAALEEQNLKLENQKKQKEMLEEECKIPKMVQKAVEEGKISLLDYYKIQNLIADTNMRKSFSTNSSQDNFINDRNLNKKIIVKRGDEGFDD